MASTTSCPFLPINFCSAPPAQGTRTSQTSPLLLSASPGSLSSGQEWGGARGRGVCAPRDPQRSMVDRSRCGDTGMPAPPAAPVRPWHRPQWRWRLLLPVQHPFTFHHRTQQPCVPLGPEIPLHAPEAGTQLGPASQFSLVQGVDREKHALFCWDH